MSAGASESRPNCRSVAVCALTEFALPAILTIIGAIELWHLFLASLLNGVLMSLNMPARQALVPQLVPRHKLMNAISLQMGEMNLTRIIAPALAGMLVAPLGLGWVFLITWLPRYLKEVHQVPIYQRGWMTSVPVLVGMAGMLVLRSK